MGLSWIMSTGLDLSNAILRWGGSYLSVKLKGMLQILLSVLINRRLIIQFRISCPDDICFECSAKRLRVA